jgi:hypothetical protein
MEPFLHMPRAFVALDGKGFVQERPGNSSVHVSGNVDRCEAGVTKRTKLSGVVLSEYRVAQRMSLAIRAAEPSPAKREAALLLDGKEKPPTSRCGQLQADGHETILHFGLRPRHF